METNNAPAPKRHLFICTKCKIKGKEHNENHAADLRKRFKKKLGELYSKDELRVNAAGCLGVCEEGIHAVIYPEAIWFKNIDDSSFEDISNYIKNLSV